MTLPWVANRGSKGIALMSGLQYASQEEDEISKAKYHIQTKAYKAVLRKKVKAYPQ